MATQSFYGLVKSALDSARAARIQAEGMGVRGKLYSELKKAEEVLENARRECMKMA